jgi:hypothetical protein
MTEIGSDTHASFGLRQRDTYLLTSSPVPKPQFDDDGSRHAEEGDVEDIPLRTKARVHPPGTDRAFRNARTRRSINPLISNFTSPIGGLLFPRAYPLTKFVSDLIYDPAYETRPLEFPQRF